MSLPMTLPLRARDIHIAEVILREYATGLEHQHQELEEENLFLATGIRAQAADAALKKLSRLNYGRKTLVQVLGAAAYIMARTAQAQADLEDAYHRVLKQAADNPLHTAMLQDLQSLGEVLDYACAQEINALCTDAPKPPHTSFGELEDWPLDRIHEHMWLHATPEIQEFLNSHPEVRALEVSEDTMVLAIGDLESAPASITFIPGTGSSDPTRWEGSLERAQKLQQHTKAGVVLWLGAKAPPHLPHALNPGPARRDAGALQNFQRSLAARYPHQHRVVLGYSYGAVTAAQAARGSGLSADRLMLLGSPGVRGARRASELTLIDEKGRTHPAEGRVHALTNRGDPIDWVSNSHGGVHGVDPTSRGFGATVWSARGDHSSYWDDPEFYRIMKELTKP